MDQFEPRQLGRQRFLDVLKSSDESVLRLLYTRNYKQLENYVQKNSGTAEDARDVYQEAFLAVWRNVQLDRFVPDDENDFNAYLFRVGKNKWIDEIRKRTNKYHVSIDTVSGDDVTADAEPDETDAYINAVKNKYVLLGARCRELLGRFYFRKQHLREIAAAFDWTEASAKNNKYRCLKKLRDMVVKEERTNG